MKFRPYPYQERAARHILEHTHCALFLEMGLGKTASTLLAIKSLLWTNDVRKVLVIAPLRVAFHTWPAEIAKWSDFKDLTYTPLRGTPGERIRLMQRDTDLYLINCEMVSWLVDACRTTGWPFDMVVIDESSRFKNPSAHRFKRLRATRQETNRCVELTGTPAPNGLLDLWAPTYLLDGGERLGKTFGAFKGRWFQPTDRWGRKLAPRSFSAKQIYQRLSDIAMSMKAEDYLTLPPAVANFIPVTMPADAWAGYNRLENDMFLQLQAGAEKHDIEPFNAAALTNKCLQYSNGAVYLQNDDGSPSKEWLRVHDAKLDALEEVIEGAAGAPVMVAYWFQSDLARIKERFPQCQTLGKTGREIDAWNRGEIPLLAVHPNSAGHGLNLQDGGNILCWYSMTWSLEAYQQTNARLHRQGQEKPVYIHHLLCTGTLDDEVRKRIEGKAEVQDLLMERLKAKEAA